MRVHLSIAQVHHESLVTNESVKNVSNLLPIEYLELHLRLVVTLGISDCLLSMSSVGQCEANAANIPLVILDLFQGLNPHIGDSHAETIVESYSSERQR